MKEGQYVSSVKGVIALVREVWNIDKSLFSARPYLLQEEECVGLLAGAKEKT